MIPSGRDPLSVTEVAVRTVLPLDLRNRSVSETVDAATEVVEEWLDVTSEEAAGVPFGQLGGSYTDASFVVRFGDFEVEVVEDADAIVGSPYGLRVSRGDHRDGRWTTDVSVRAADGVVIVDASRSVQVLAERRLAIPREVPPFVAKLVDAFGVRDGPLRVSPRPHLIEAPHECRLLADAIRGERRMPIVVVSEPLSIDPSLLAIRLYGVAHVVSLSVESSFELSRLIGLDLSVYGGAIRTYRVPFLGPSDTVPYHPVILARAIEGFVDRESQRSGPEAFIDTLVDRVMRNSIGAFSHMPRYDVDALKTALRSQRRAAAKALPGEELSRSASVAAIETSAEPTTVSPEPPPDASSTISEVTELEQALARSKETITSQASTIRSLEDRVEAVENDWFALLSDYERLKVTAAASLSLADGMPTAETLATLGLDSLAGVLRHVVGATQSVVEIVQAQIEEREEQRLDADLLRQRLAVAEARLRATSTPVSSAAYPTSLESTTVQSWVNEHLADKLRLHPRALRALDAAMYDAPADVFEALHILGNEYRDMRLRDATSDGPRLAFEERLRSAGLRVGRSISESQRGRFYAAYHVPAAGGGDQFLDMHLRNGGATSDPTRCLRVYFYWDDVTRQVVVGSLPGHLPNRLS